MNEREKQMDLFPGGSNGNEPSEEAERLLLEMTEGPKATPVRTPTVKEAAQKRIVGRKVYEKLREETWKQINRQLIKEGKKPEPGTPVDGQNELDFKKE